MDGEISFRLADETDVMFLFKLRNDPFVRANSITTEELEFISHKNWFLKTIDNPERKLFIAQLDQKDIGQVRFDKEPINSAEISISLCADYRGKGLGSVILKKAVQLAFSNLNFNSILAKVKKNNTASVKIFQKANFKEKDQEGDLLIMELTKPKIKIGIKLWSTNKELIKKAKESFLKKEFDYMELSAIKNTFDKEILSNLKGIPVIIHCDNDSNLAKKELYEENIAAIKEAQKFADFLNAKYIILHPGYDGDISNINKILNEFNDKRICMENMPAKTVDSKFDCIGRIYEELEKINCNNYCLDFAHAIKTAIALNIGIFKNIKELLKLNPAIFHISDGTLDNEVDEHLNIGDGDFDFKEILGLIRDKDAFISIETPKKDFNSLDNDLANIKKIKNFLN